MEKEPLIVSDPRIMVGKPVIKGTRITVELILRKVAAGQTIEQILKDYPHLTEEGIRAALEFAAKSVSLERVYISNQESKFSKGIQNLLPRVSGQL